MDNLLNHVLGELVNKGYVKANNIEAYTNANLPTNLKELLRPALEDTQTNKCVQYFLTSKEYADTIIVVNCGKDLKTDMDVAFGFAGCLNAVKKNVVGIVAEAKGTQFDINSFIVRADGTAVTASPIGSPNYAFGFTGKEILSFDEYMYFINREYEKKAQPKKPEASKTSVANNNVSAKTKAELEMIAHVEKLSAEINWILYENGDIPSDLRMMAVIACILALRDESFRNNYKTLRRRYTSIY